MIAISIVVGLLPVMLFLIGLIFMDSYKLVRGRAVLTAIVFGVGAAATCYLANRFALQRLHVPHGLLTGLIAPALEETVKALYLAYLIRTHRVGFMVDAGVQGFAVGTGFALLENIYYAGTLGAAGIFVWVVRGLGTAIMHGSTTALVAIVSRDLIDRHPPGHWQLFLPGLALAVTVHAVFNLLSGNPLLATAFLLLAMPLLLFTVFERSERATRDWLGTGLDLDVELLDQITSGEVVDTRIGRYIHSLKERFPGEVVADMLCLLEIHLELSARAKGLMIARAAGIELPLDTDVRANLQEMKFLEKSIGPTGLMALMPCLRTSSRDLWHLYMLKSEQKPGR
jgi:RsiW-degrading membrane proteinase PrsW (M82 family)